MAVRNIVKIDEEKCNGCGLCVSACAEGAIKMIEGKARLVSDSYCDGLGACLGECPQGAITIEQRDAAAFDEEAVKRGAGREARVARQHKQSPTLACGCPGTMARALAVEKTAGAAGAETPSQLANWPVQLKLVSPHAPYFQQADLLLVADCVPCALANFHSRFLRGNPVVIACPKLDEGIPDYVEKLAELITANHLRSLTVMHMEVPCCSGIVRIAQAALEQAGVEIPTHDITVGINGTVLREGTL